MANRKFEMYRAGLMGRRKAVEVRQVAAGRQHQQVLAVR